MAFESYMDLKDHEHGIKGGKKQDVHLLHYPPGIQRRDLGASINEGTEEDNCSQQLNVPKEQSTESCDHFWSPRGLIPLERMEGKQAGEEVTLFQILPRHRRNYSLDLPCGSDLNMIVAFVHRLENSQSVFLPQSHELRNPHEQTITRTNKVLLFLKSRI